MMVSEPLDRDPADRLDRSLDALVRGEPARPPHDPTLRPLLSTVGRIVRRRSALSTAARQRIWRRIETASQAESIPAGLERERSPIMATLPRPFGERIERPARRVRRWRPVLELTVVALLLLALIGGVLVQRPSRTPSVPGLITAPEATPGPTNLRYTLNLRLQVMSRTEPTASPVLLDAERDVISKRIEALGIEQYKITVGPDALLVQLSQINLPAKLVERVLMQTGEFEAIDAQGNDLPLGTAVNTIFGNAPGSTPAAGQVYPTWASSEDVVNAIVPTGPSGSYAVVVQLSRDAEMRLTQHVQSQNGTRLVYLLDHRVVGFAVYPGPSTNNARPIVSIVLPALPPVYALGTPIPTPPPGTTMMPQNALLAILSSGPLLAPVTIIGQAPVTPPVASPTVIAGTPVNQASGTPSAPYELDLMLKVGSANQPVDMKTLDNEVQVLTRRATALGLTVAQANAFGSNSIHIHLTQVNPPAEFVEAVLTQTGLFEIVDPQAKILAPGDEVTTTLGGPADAATQGSTYTTLVSSGGIVGAKPRSGSARGSIVDVELNDPAAAKMAHYAQTQVGASGRVMYAYVLDKRVLTTVTVGRSSPPTPAVSFPPMTEVALPVQPPVTSLDSPFPSPLFGEELPPQNAIIAILKSGALPATVVIDSATAAPPVTAQSATPAPTATVPTPVVPRPSQTSLNPNAAKIMIQVDADGVRVGDPEAVAQALAQLQTKLRAFTAPCRVGMVLTYGAGDVGPGNELASAINNLMKNNFPDLGAQSAVYWHFSDNGLDAGTVKLDLYFFEGCPAVVGS